jgi:uncharacterized membrane protein YkvA (DUF1232 family)
MATLADRGLKISKNVIFSVLTQKAARLLGKPGKIGLLLHDAYQKLTTADSGKSGLVQVKELMFTLIRLVRNFISGRYRQISTKTIVIGVATLLYFLMPFDLVPDFIPALGLMDDLSLMAWFIRAFQGELVKYQEWESRQVFTA